MELILILQVTTRNLNYIKNWFGYSCTCTLFKPNATPYNYIVSQSFFFFFLSNTLLVNHFLVK